MVDLDLTLVFRVVNPDTFVYQLGASKFDILLRGSVEEAIRHLARQYVHQNILNLRGSGCAEFLQSLSEQFKPFGVLFT